MGTYSHLLVGLDLSSESEPVLQKAIALAKAMNADISVVHTIEPLTFTYGADMPIDLSETQQIMEEQARIRLDKVIDEHQITPKAAVIAVGNTAHELHRIADEHNVDLIVVGSHGRHGLALLLGSTANGVLHGANTDVLAVKV
ncbi:universal stress protein [Teredinibacter sp. KSP-S5-2]|uniref:universal stress protein n=1 Tax=Teredinibacter sp. KSP-S5-2 TaxID=3034506 RepID=UPI0029342716|nr:universal stress protein [Teredinibacter sp. KSP-S5-2]WNO11219.1 universal stress protein [Teredinibacter sp. KSP-S5-2]